MISPQRAAPQRANVVLSKPWRSTSVRLALGYALLFILSSALLLGVLWWRTASYLDREVDAVIVSDVQGIAERLQDFGLAGAIETINHRVGEYADEHAVYLLADPALTPIAGNLVAWPLRIGHRDGWYQIDLAREGKLHATRVMYVSLPQGFRLLVGRDVQDRVAIRQTLVDGLGWTVISAFALAIVGGLLVRRMVLARVESINRTTAAIVHGDLSRRVPSRHSADEFDQLAITINGMLQQIEVLVDGVRNASNAVAHDLRTPLAELRSRLEGLLQSRPDAETTWAEIRAAVGDVDRLIGIFNALLRLAEIDSGARLAGFRQTSLEHILTEVAELYGVVAEDKEIDLVLEPAPDIAVNGDPSLLAQAIGNLVDNAVKYAPAPGKVTLSLTPRPDCQVAITVADNGPGIPEAERTRVTERFYRGGSAQGTPGVGLGLSVVVAVARLHGGELRLEDGNPGLVATLVLPAG